MIRIRSLKLMIVGLLALQFLSGCASLSKEECLNAEWYTIGYEDGLAGRLRSRLGDHREACAEYGVKPDPQKYFHGYDDGLAKFCVPKNAYRAGAGGRTILVTCPADLAYDFDQAYRYGKRVYRAEREYQNHRRAIDERRTQLSKLRENIRKVEAQLVGGNAHHGQRLGKSKALLKREIELKMQIAELQRSANDNPAGASEDKRKQNGRKNGNRGTENREKNGRRKGQEKDRKNRSGNGKNISVKDDGGKKNNNGQKLVHDKKRDALKTKYRQLAEVRHTIRKLEEEERRQQGNSRQQRLHLLQESKRLTREEGKLEAELRFLETQSEGLLQRVRLLKRRSPY